MNTSKLQIETVKAMTTQSSRVYSSELEGDVILTFDGYSAYRLSPAQCCVDLSKAKKLDTMKDFFLLGKDDKQVSKSPLQYCTRDGILYGFKGENFTVWVKKALYEKFADDQEVWCSSPISPVKLVSKVTGKVEAIVLPTRTNSAVEI